jgi:hypothetical protein
LSAAYLYGPVKCTRKIPEDDDAELVTHNCWPIKMDLTVGWIPGKKAVFTNRVDVFFHHLQNICIPDYI